MGTGQKNDTDWTPEECQQSIAASLERLVDFSEFLEEAILAACLKHFPEELKKSPIFRAAPRLFRALRFVWMNSNPGDVGHDEQVAEALSDADPHWMRSETELKQ